MNRGVIIHKKATFSRFDPETFFGATVLAKLVFPTDRPGDARRKARAMLFVQMVKYAEMELGRFKRSKDNVGPSPSTVHGFLISIATNGTMWAPTVQTVMDRIRAMVK